MSFWSFDYVIPSQRVFTHFRHDDDGASTYGRFLHARVSSREQYPRTIEGAWSPARWVNNCNQAAGYHTAAPRENKFVSQVVGYDARHGNARLGLAIDSPYISGTLVYFAADGTVEFSDRWARKAETPSTGALLDFLGLGHTKCRPRSGGSSYRVLTFPIPLTGSGARRGYLDVRLSGQTGFQLVDVPRRFAEVFKKVDHHLRGFETPVFPHVSAWGRFVYPLECDAEHTAKLRGFDHIWRRVRKPIEALLGFNVTMTLEQTGLSVEYVWGRMRDFTDSLEKTDQPMFEHLYRILTSSQPLSGMLAEFMATINTREIADRFIVEVFGSPEKMAAVWMALIPRERTICSWGDFKKRAVGATRYRRKKMLPDIDQTALAVARWLHAVGHCLHSKQPREPFSWDRFTPSQQMKLREVCCRFVDEAKEIVNDAERGDYLTWSGADGTSSLDRHEGEVPLALIHEAHVIFGLGVDALVTVHGKVWAGNIINRLRGVYADGLHMQHLAMQEDWRHQFYQAPNAKERKRLAQDPLRPENIGPLAPPKVRETNFLSLLFAPLTSVLMAFVKE